MGADGHVTKSGAISISQSNEDGYDLISYIREMIGYNGVIYKSKNVNTLFVSDNIISQCLSYKGIVRNKTLTFTPQSIPNRYIKSFIRGYFEGDGSVGIYNNGGSEKYLKCSFVGTREFVKFVIDKIPRGFRLFKIKRCKNLVEIRYNGYYAYHFLKWLYSSPLLYRGRKYNIFKSWDTSECFKIKELSKMKQAKHLYYDRKMSCEKIAKSLNTNFQKIYEWKSKGFKYSVEKLSQQEIDEILNERN